MQEIERLLRDLTPQVLAAVVRKYGDLPLCEDAVQEALLNAALQWPGSGLPSNPTGWLVTAASRRRIEQWRSDSARRRREHAFATQRVETSDGRGLIEDRDDTLTLFLLCVHPSLTPAAQLALTLRAVGGLTTGEIARALLLPEATVAQRISRAKQRIKASGAQFRMPPEADLPARMSTLCRVLYLVFNEGHTASAGIALHRLDLAAEAIRLTRLIRAKRPDDGEVAGLLALMLLTDARRPARSDRLGNLVSMAEQDRTLWDGAEIAEGVALITASLAETPVGPYQLQAAIAAVHDEAGSADETDWPQILGLYELLRVAAPGPMVELSRVVALAMVEGPSAGLAELAEIEREQRLAGHHRPDAIRAHLLELAGNRDAARDFYQRAARRTLNLPERRYLEARAQAIG